MSAVQQCCRRHRRLSPSGYVNATAITPAVDPANNLRGVVKCCSPGNNNAYDDVVTTQIIKSIFFGFLQNSILTRFKFSNDKNLIAEAGTTLTQFVPFPKELFFFVAVFIFNFLFKIVFFFLVFLFQFSLVRVTFEIATKAFLSIHQD